MGSFFSKVQLMSGNGEIMGDCGWSWVVATKLWLVVHGHGSLGMVMCGPGWLHNLVMPQNNPSLSGKQILLQSESSPNAEWYILY